MKCTNFNANLQSGFVKSLLDIILWSKGSFSITFFAIISKDYNIWYCYQDSL